MSVHRDIEVGIVAIGRNEGARLAQCLASLPVNVPRVYVDSGSADDSVTIAQRAGAHVIALASPPKFSAARARNAGVAWLRDHYPGLTDVMLVDGDCEIAPGWIAAASAAMIADPALGVVFGRRRERYPGRSIYNALCDDEWNHPVGEASTCGGDVFCRLDALAAISGYREMIAGEDPDMAGRMREAGWRVYRLDAEMTIHDAAILHFSQWWQRSRRSGHAFGELAHLNAGPAFSDWRRQCRSIVAWGVLLPFMVVLTAAVGMTVGRSWLIAAMLLLALWPGQFLRLVLRRSDLPAHIAIANAFFLLLGKVAQAVGLAEFHVRRWTRRESKLIEYKVVG